MKYKEYYYVGAPCWVGASTRHHWSNLWRAVLALACFCCGKSPAKTPPSKTTTFAGTFIAGSANGMLTITVLGPASEVSPARDPVLTATATLRPSGGVAVSLGGTYDATTETLTLSGGGYAITGTLSDGVLSGTANSSSDSGVFVATLASSGGGTYCGSWVETQGNNLSGGLNVVLSGATAVGVLCQASGPACCEYLQGNVSGSGVTLTGFGGSCQAEDSAVGTLAGGSVKGALLVGDNQGNWLAQGCD